MTSAFEQVRLGDLLTESREWMTLKPEVVYRQVTVRMWGKGVVLRGKVPGAEIAAEKQLRVRADQFILSRIDARNGAFGLIPDDLDGAVVSNDFPVFTPRSDRMLAAYLNWMSKTSWFVKICQRSSEGTTNRKRLQESRFLAAEVPLPPLAEQQRIVARIEELAGKIEEAKRLRQEVAASMGKLLACEYARITAGVPSRTMGEVAPLVRRIVGVNENGSYLELGIRSFGKGTFHKPSISGLDLGTKRIFAIEPDDLLFNIVFAWEGAVAVARPEDAGRVGSHRFLTCVPIQGIALPRFLRFHFLTPAGLSDLGEASPGGAGRNRTLSMKGLEAIRVPVPPYADQLWFDQMLDKNERLALLQDTSSPELDALLPSVLERAFSGAL